MRSSFEPEAKKEILSRIEKLSPRGKRLWGKGMYKHLDHHLKQFGV